jgi:hypothetical protein
MPDQTQPGQAPDTTDPAAPKDEKDPKGAQTDPQPSQTEPDAPDGEDFDKARAMATITKLRGFEKQARDQAKELETLRAAQKEAENAKLSEQEKLQNRVKELETQAAALAEEKKSLLVRTAVEREARKLNLVDEDAAYRLLDLNAIEFGDDGTPKNVETLLKALAKDKPYLVAQANGKAPITATPRPDDGRAQSQAEILRLRQAELQEARAAM